MTSLIDVIFLLLLFFMLSSTFSKFGDVALQVGSAGNSVEQPQRVLFLRLEEDRLSLNGVTLSLPALAARLSEASAPNVLVSIRPDVTAQRMTDLLVALRAAPDTRLVLLGDE